MKYLLKRGDVWYYFRRVPEEVAHLETRKFAKISLKTNDHSLASAKAFIYNAYVEDFWRSLARAGTAENIEEKYQECVRLAKKHGFSYKPTDEIALSSMEEIVQRFSKPIGSPQQAEALLGGAEVPKIKLSECTDKYFEYSAAILQGKSEHGQTKWKNPRRAAMNDFIGVVGDKALDDVTRKDIMAFKEWWIPRINDGMSPGTANKQLRFLKKNMGLVAHHMHFDMDFEAMFSKTSFAQNDISRPPFEADYVQNVLLKSLDGMGEDSRLVIHIMADTGMRESEIIGLRPEDIFLDVSIPYVWVRPYEGHQLKTKTSERKIPLVGAALYAFRLRPQGFKSRWGNPDSFSAFGNRFLTERGLRPTPQHTLYSLRHTFKDRLRDIQAPEEIIDDLMGHKKSGPKYGRGHRLETKLEWMERIAFKLPDRQ